MLHERGEDDRREEGEDSHQQFLRALFNDALNELGEDGNGIVIGDVNANFQQSFAQIQFPTPEVRQRFFAICAERIK